MVKLDPYQICIVCEQVPLPNITLGLTSFDARRIRVNPVPAPLQLPKISKPSYYYFSITSLEEIDPSIEGVLDSQHSGYLHFADNKKLICDSKINWMAKRVQGPGKTVRVEGSVCANGTKRVKTYLEEILEATPPPKSFWGIFQSAFGVGVGNVV